MLKYKEYTKLEDIGEYDLYVENALLESEIEAQKTNAKYYTLEEFDKEMRKIINEKI